MKKIKDIDKHIIFFLPVLIISSLAFLDDTTGIYASLMGLAIFAYLLMVYDKRMIYGFNGLQVLSIPSIIIFTFTIFLAIPGVYICTIHDTKSVIPFFSALILFYFMYPFGLKIAGIFKQIDIAKVKEIRYAELKRSIFLSFFWVYY